jgi:hypothetical protein
MNTLKLALSRLLRRRPFAVIGYSAEDETYCPTCLRLTTGLSPGGIDTWGKPVLALYARDETVHDEVCASCHQRLLELVPGLQPTLTFSVVHRVKDDDSTIVRHVQVGTMLLHADGRGSFFSTLSRERFEIFPDTGASLETPIPATAKPPTLRHHATAAA